MEFWFWVGLLAAGGLAFANGANDISKSIATLVGAGESSYKKAVVWASVAAGIGAALGGAWGAKMVVLFSQGVLSGRVQISQAFALAVLGGSLGWVLLSSRRGWPISTTHSIVGSVILAGVYAYGFSEVRWGAVGARVFLPLLLSPVLAYGIAFLAHRFLYWLCRQKYCLSCNCAHWISSLSSAFARGLNDTPKIASLGLVFYAAGGSFEGGVSRWIFPFLGLANALGGIVWGLRTTETLAYRVTKIEPLDGFASNLATSCLVLATAVHGFPVSTTHVSSGAIMGMGLRKGWGAVHWPAVRKILLAWLVTLPGAGLIAVALFAAGSAFGGSPRDPYATFLKPDTKTAVPREEILHGGPPVDGIPPISDPAWETASEARWLAGSDEVLGLAIGTEARAYPLRILNWHEIVNDTVGKIPVAVTYCPLCRTGIAFDRRMDGPTGGETTFGVSGLLYQSAMVMYDRKTESLWSQVLGEAIAGPSLGKKLKTVPLVHTTWASWKKRHPDTLVLSRKTGHSRDYSRSPYESYETSAWPSWFPTRSRDRRLRPKDVVFGVRIGEKAFAVPVKAAGTKWSADGIAESGRAADRQLEIRREVDGFRAFLISEKSDPAGPPSPEEIAGTLAYWFAWSSFYPDTELLAGE